MALIALIVLTLLVIRAIYLGLTTEARRRSEFARVRTQAVYQETEEIPELHFAPRIFRSRYW
jgi:hypothetical protein